LLSRSDLRRHRRSRLP